MLETNLAGLGLLLIVASLVAMVSRLVWGGLRGAVGLALALSVPESVAEQQEIVVLTFGVVAFSIFVQGLTIPPLLRHWKLTEG